MNYNPIKFLKRLCVIGGIAVATTVPTFLTGCGKQSGKLNLEYDLNDNYSAVLNAVSVPVNTVKLPVKFGNYEAEIPGGNIDKHLFGFVRRGNELLAMENPTKNLTIYDEKQAVLQGPAVLLGKLSRYHEGNSRVKVHSKEFGVLLPVTYIDEQLPVGVHQGNITLEGVEFAQHQGYLFAKTLDKEGKFLGLYAFRRPIPEVEVKGLELIIKGNGLLVLGSEAGKGPRKEQLELLIPLPDEVKTESPKVEAPKVEEPKPQFLIEPQEDPIAPKSQNTNPAEALIQRVDELLRY